MTALGEGIQSSWYRIRIRIGGLIGSFGESRILRCRNRLLEVQTIEPPAADPENLLPSRLEARCRAVVSFFFAHNNAF
jgi:hypothetical protein